MSEFLVEGAAVTAIGRQLVLRPFGRRSSANAVAKAGFVEDEDGVVGVIAQFASQPFDNVSHRAGTAGFVRLLDPLQQLVVGQHLAGVSR